MWVLLLSFCDFADVRCVCPLVKLALEPLCAHIARDTILSKRQPVVTHPCVTRNVYRYDSSQSDIRPPEGLDQPKLRPLTIPRRRAHTSLIGQSRIDLPWTPTSIDRNYDTLIL